MSDSSLRSSPSPEKPPKNAIATAIKAIFAIAISAFALWWALRGVDLGYVWANVTRTSLGMIVLFLVIQVVIQLSRVVRYALLVKPLGSPSNRAIFASVCVGLPAAVFLPLRLGEFVRPLMIARAGVPIAGAFASVVVERIVDGLVNVGMFFLLLNVLPETASVDPAVRTGGVVALAGFGGLLVFLVLASVARPRVLGMTEAVLSRISAPMAKKLVSLLSTFLDGLVALNTLPRLLAFFALTAVYWGLNGYATYLIARSYGLEVPVISGWYAIACVVFAVMVPAAPGFAGTLEAGFKIGFSPFGVADSDIALVALVSHVLQLGLLAIYTFVGFQAAETAQRSKAPIEGIGPRAKEVAGER